MTLAEFKAWFEGFTEGMDSTPNAKQWERIQKRVKEIDGTPVTREIYIDRYWPRWTYWNAPNMSSYYTTCNAAYAAQNPAKAEWVAQLSGQSATWNSTDGMYALGKADAEDIAA